MCPQVHLLKTIKCYDETGPHVERPRKGGPRVTSAAEFIRVTSLRNHKLTAPQIRAQVNATQSCSSRHISTSTVQRRLHQSGLYGQTTATKPLLRKSNKKKRFVWAKKHKEWTLDQWKSVLWSDESKFEIFGSTCCVFVWRRKGERMVSTCMVPTVKHRGGGVMVWGCFAGDTLGIYSELKAHWTSKATTATCHFMRLIERMPGVCKAVIKTKGGYFEESTLWNMFYFTLFCLLRNSICVHS